MDTRGADGCEGNGGKRAEEERYAHGGDCAMHRERYLARHIVYYQLQESPYVTETEINQQHKTDVTGPRMRFRERIELQISAQNPMQSHPPLQGGGGAPPPP